MYVARASHDFVLLTRVGFNFQGGRRPKVNIQTHNTLEMEEKGLDKTSKTIAY